MEQRADAQSLKLHHLVEVVEAANCLKTATPWERMDRHSHRYLLLLLEVLFEDLRLVPVAAPEAEVVSFLHSCL